MDKNEIINKTEEFMRSNVPDARKPDENYFRHVLGARDYGLMLAREYRADEFVIEIAALLHDVGANWGPEHAEISAQMATEYLADKEIDIKTRDMIISCVRKHSMGSEVDGIEEQIIQDADGLIFIEDTFKNFYFKKRKKLSSSAEAIEASVHKTEGMMKKIKTPLGQKVASDLLPKAIEWIKNQD